MLLRYYCLPNNKILSLYSTYCRKILSKKFRKLSCPIVERLVGSLQFHGRNTGKKIKAIRIVKHAFEIIHLLTGKNPVDVFIKAVMNAGPREDSTRIGNAGVVRK